MKKLNVLRWTLVALCSGVLGMVVAAPMRAQSNAMTTPQVLVINREYLKPGRTGTMHERTEAAYIAAAKAGKAPFHYLAVTSMSGADRALFMSGYPSFAAWEAENKTIPDATGVALDHAMVADGDLLASTDEGIWMRDDAGSMNPAMVIPGLRFVDLSLFTLKPGHEAEWIELVKLVKQGYAKGVPDASWTSYAQVYGSYGTSYLIVTPLKSAAEIDHNFATGKDFEAAMGKEGMAKMAQLEAACVQSQQNNLFRVSRKMSIPLDAWVAADPDFWKPKAAAPAKQAVTP